MFQKKVLLYLISQFIITNLVDCAHHIKKIGFWLLSFLCNVRFSFFKFFLIVLIGLPNNRNDICIFLKLRDGNEILLATGVLKDVQYQMNSTILDLIFLSCILLGVFKGFFNFYLFELVYYHSFSKLMDNVGSALLDGLNVSDSWGVDQIQLKLMLAFFLWLNRVLNEIFCLFSDIIYFNFLTLISLIYIYPMLFVFFFVVLLFLCIFYQLFSNLEIKFSKKEIYKGRLATPRWATHHYIKIYFWPYFFWLSCWISQSMHVFKSNWILQIKYFILALHIFKLFFEDLRMNTIFLRLLIIQIRFEKIIYFFFFIYIHIWGLLHFFLILLFIITLFKFWIINFLNLYLLNILLIELFFSCLFTIT